MFQDLFNCGFLANKQKYFSNQVTSSLKSFQIFPFIFVSPKILQFIPLCTHYKEWCIVMLFCINITNTQAQYPWCSVIIYSSEFLKVQSWDQGMRILGDGGPEIWRLSNSVTLLFITWEFIYVVVSEYLLCFRHCSRPMFSTNLHSSRVWGGEHRNKKMKQT